MHEAAPSRAASARETKGGEIVLRDIAIDFDRFRAVEGITLTIEPGEFVCLLGPSGCGKSTILNLVAGFVPAAAGEATVGGDPVLGPAAGRGIVFQSTEALFPWLTVRQNVDFGPRMRRLPSARRRESVERHLSLVGLTRAADRYPHELSGGMRQRVQIARVLANEPSVVLMDEPFGALDAQTRELMQHELVRIWSETRPTIVFVTHDIDEALLLGDRIATMTSGPAARIKSVRSVSLPRPRDETDPELIELHRELRREIREEVSRSLRADERVQS